MNKFIKDFVNFVREQGIVGLAVGLAIGLQASGAVASIVDNFIDPLVGLVLNGTDLSSISTTIIRNGQELVFGWGAILNSIISLVATALVIFFVIDKAGLTKLDKKKQDK
jgi:large conductance mechanosensitive channel